MTTATIVTTTVTTTVTTATITKATLATSIKKNQRVQPCKGLHSTNKRAMIIKLKTEYIGEFTEWKMALDMALDNEEADSEYYEYKEDGFYVLEVEQRLAIKAKICMSPESN